MKIKRSLSTIIILSIFVGTFVFQNRNPITVSANDEENKAIDISKNLYWSFYQSGKDSQSVSDNPVNAGYINSVVLNSGEEFNSWERDKAKAEIKTAAMYTNGFEIDIENTGYDADFKNEMVNPYSIQAKLQNIPIEERHIYKLSFKAKASKKKLAYVNFCVSDDNYNPENENLEQYIHYYNEPKASKTIVLIPEEKEYAYQFTSWKSLDYDFSLMFGAFSTFTKDYSGEDISYLMNGDEVLWNGTVMIRDFKIEDIGIDYPSPIPTDDIWETPTTDETITKDENSTIVLNSETTTEKSDYTVKPTVIRKLTARKKALKVKWKKKNGVRGYQIQYAKNKNFKYAKIVTIYKKTSSRIIKNLESKKKYYVRIRTFIKVNNKKVLSNWSKYKSKKTK